MVDAEKETREKTRSNKKTRMVILITAFLGLPTIFCGVPLMWYLINGAGSLGDSCYEIDGSKVYLKFEERESWDSWSSTEERIEVVGADADTFVDVSSGNCWRQYGSTRLNFHAVGRDDSAVYVIHEEQKGVSPDQFEVLENKTPVNVPPFFSNKDDVYYFDKSESELISLGLDPSEVEVLDGSYIKDTTAVYYDKSRIGSTNPVGFKVISAEGTNYLYGVDGGNVFISGMVITEIASPVSWQPLSDAYSKDDVNVYFHSRYEDTVSIVNSADSDNFISATDIAGSEFQFGLDGKELPYGRDGSAIYFEETRVYDADPGGLEPINWNFWSDGNNVYYKTRLVEGADVDNFEVAEFLSAVGRDRVTGEEFDFVSVDY